MTKKIIVTRITVEDYISWEDVHIEDSGMCKYFEIGNDFSNINVQVGSYAYDKNHGLFENLLERAITENKKIKITIEVED